MVSAYRHALDFVGGAWYYFAEFSPFGQLGGVIEKPKERPFPAIIRAITGYPQGLYYTVCQTGDTAHVNIHLRRPSGARVRIRRPITQEQVEAINRENGR